MTAPTAQIIGFGEEPHDEDSPLMAGVRAIEEQENKLSSHLEYVCANDIDECDEHFNDEMVERVLGSDGMSVIYGDSNSGKTFLAIDLSCAIARGISWHGQRTDCGAVLYLATEGYGSVRNRIKAYKRHHQVKEMPVYVVRSPVNFFDGDADALQVIKLIQDIENRHRLKVRLIVGDTMARISTGANENSGQDMGIVIKHAEMVRDMGMAHFLWIHHCGKDAARGMRGWSGFRAFVDTEIEVAETPDSPVRSVEITKQRDGDGKGDRYGFTLHSVTIGANRWGDTRSTCVVIPDEAPDKAKAKTKNAGLLARAISLAGTNEREKVRVKYYELHTGTPDARKKAFSRAWGHYMNVSCETEDTNASRD